MRVEHRSPNVDDGLLKVDTFDVQTSKFADSHAGSKHQCEEDLVNTLRGIDNLLRFLRCEVTLFFLDKRRKLHGPGLGLFGQYQPQDFIDVLNRLRFETLLCLLA